MMRAYTYPAATYGQGGLRLIQPLAVPVERPEDADVLVLPQTVCTLARTPALWAQFWDEPEVRRRPERLVAFDCDDSFNPIPLQGVCYIRCGASAGHVRTYPTTIPWPWPAPDLGWILKDAGPLVYDVTFQGWATPLDCTPRAVASCRAAFPADRCHLAVYREFHGYQGRGSGNHFAHDLIGGLTGSADVTRDETIRREAAYRDGLRHARLVLSPQSIVGVPRYRVFEAMSAARLPVWIGHDTAPPLADRVDWGRVSIQIDSGDVDRTGEILARWLHDTPEAEQRAREAEAQAAWARWFDKDRFPENMTRVVAERFGLLL